MKRNAYAALLQQIVIFVKCCSNMRACLCVTLLMRHFRIGSGKSVRPFGSEETKMDALLPTVRAFHRAIFVLGISALCASCSSKPALYQELASSRQLRATSLQTDQRVAFNTELKPGALKPYASVLLEPVRIYRGKDSQFGDLSEQSKTELARYAGQTFRRELARQQLLELEPDKNTLRMRVTITGATSSVPVLSTATRLTPVGFAMSGLRSIGDKEGNFSGAVIYAVELFDAANDRLVYAFVTRQYPNALNIAATVLPLDAAKAGIERGASTTATALKSLMGRVRR
ncbi:DUF3313 domain-containing protein [Agrobacterium sp. B1(2019)]|uniref:DUF3313 domain-containing protein n=1 Tax=Agrobacterium sp. B1(2019) TaxID=2607032 RepID=UPI0011EC46EF|nr:DUF3313 domain-containing protein [Agrobacterium sp. B1(2019)]TZG32461.1 DUF3313 domain-containing protein [Agrobacterium sp. B1(2019)]